MTPHIDLTRFAFIGTPGLWQLLIVALIILVLFGNRLPSVMRSLGEGITEFKKGIKGGDDNSSGGKIEDQGETHQ